MSSPKVAQLERRLQGKVGSAGFTDEEIEEIELQGEESELPMPKYLSRYALPKKRPYAFFDELNTKGKDAPLTSDINARDKEGVSILEDAFCDCNMDKINLLLQYKVNVHARNNYGQTILHVAAIGSRRMTDEFKLYLDAFVEEHKLNTEERDREGNTPLALAAKTNNHAMFDFLVSLNAAINVVNYRDESIADLAMMHGNVDILRKILESKMIDINKQNRVGQTILHRAINITQRKGVVELLLEFKANPRIKDTINGRDCYEYLSDAPSVYPLAAFARLNQKLMIAYQQLLLAHSEESKTDQPMTDAQLIVAKSEAQLVVANSTRLKDIVKARAGSAAEELSSDDPFAAPTQSKKVILISCAPAPTSSAYAPTKESALDILTTPVVAEADGDYSTVRVTPISMYQPASPKQKDLAVNQVDQIVPTGP